MADFEEGVVKKMLSLGQKRVKKNRGARGK
jgi:hypothetical protein